MRHLLALALFSVLAVDAHAAPGDEEYELPPGFELIEMPGSFSSPVALDVAPDGTLFVGQKRGSVRIILAGSTTQQSTKFIDIEDEVNHSGDRGLLGLALHPGFVADGGPTSWVYLLYTVSPIPGLEPGYNENDQYSFSRLTRYKAIVDDGKLLADYATRHILLGNQMPDGSVPDAIASLYTSHSNGRLVFGDDGTLLVTTGDGARWGALDSGGQDDPAFDDWTHPTLNTVGPMPKEQDSGMFRAQDPRSLAGKVLRLDPQTGGGVSSNPFYDGDPFSNVSRVWALGLRNPYRATIIRGTGSVDPLDANPGVMLIGDVGGGEWEELNAMVAGGANFGWPCFDGFTTDAPGVGFSHELPNPFGYIDCGTASWGPLTGPILAMNHLDPALTTPTGLASDLTSKCVIGGVIYEGGPYPQEYTGQYFFADYVFGWIRTIEFGPNGTIAAIRPFAENLGGIVCLAYGETSGELYVSLRSPENKVLRLRYAENLTPIAVATASPSTGEAPLVVQFGSDGSSDPEAESLSYEWDFDDGSPLSTEPNPLHTYLAEGIFDATLTVTDPGGLDASDPITINVGGTPPIATITTPAMCEIYSGYVVLTLSGTAVDAQTESPTVQWFTELYHDTHTHDYAFASGEEATLTLEPHGSDDDLIYYSISMEAMDESGLVGEDHVFVLPAENILDVAGSGTLISRLDELVPPVPLGTGNADIEVIRDGVQPGALAGPETQFDTAHGGDQGDDDWIGIELDEEPSDEFRYYGLTFQDGLHHADGGWFEDLTVEVRADDDWEEVENLHVDPPYPGVAGGPFAVYELRFDPIWGDAIRLRGTPGGSTGYISVAELRAHGIDVAELDPAEINVSGEGTIIARVFGLDPPGPQGSGNPDPETIRNGTTPPVGSSSAWAQFDTEHPNPDGEEHDGSEEEDDDWIGYTFATPRTFTRVEFQEGLNQPNGGWFEELEVEVQEFPGGPWEEVDDLEVEPEYPGTILGTHYETFELAFEPIVGTGIRIIGDAGGTAEFISIGELRAFALAHDCNLNGIEDSIDIAEGRVEDLNGDGVPDECDALAADTVELSVATGGTQNWTMNAPAHAGLTYLVVGSMSGTSPGVPLGLTTVPLNPDSYTSISVLFPNSSVLVDSLGTLDGAGQATGQFVLDTSWSFLAGLTAHHAFLALGPTGYVHFVSNAVPLDFLP